MKKFLIVLLIVLLVVVGIPFAYLSLSGGSYDRDSVILGKEVMSSSQRYSVDPSSGSIDINIDKSDLYQLIADEAECGLFGYADDALSEYDLQLKKVGLCISDSSSYADAKLLYKGFIPVPVHCDFNVSADGSRISLLPENLTVGKLIRVDVSNLVDDDMLEYDLSEFHSLFDNVNSIKLTSDGLKVNIPYPLDWLMDEVEPNLSEYTMILDFVHADELDTPLPAMKDYLDGNPDSLISLIDGTKGDGEAFVRLKENLLAIGGNYTASRFSAAPTATAILICFPRLPKSLSARFMTVFSDLTRASTMREPVCLPQRMKSLFRCMPRARFGKATVFWS